MPLVSKNHRGGYAAEQLRSPESRLTELTSGRKDDKKVPELPPLKGEGRYHLDRHPLPKITKCPDAYPRSNSSTLKSSVDSTSLQDDRCSNGKHSDSGYDTLQAGRAVPEFTKLLKFQNSNISPRKSSELVYPVDEVHWDSARVRDPARDKAEWNVKLDESRPTKLSYQYSGGNRRNREGSKDVTQSHQTVESPPKNIVQSRIKAFEIGKEVDEPVLGRESLEMQEPLEMSPPMYHPNEAHVSSLKNTDQQQPSADECRRRRRKSALCDFMFGNSGSSSKESPTDSRPRSRIDVNDSEKHAKSVRDLLADFEKKSQLVKERQAAEEERSSEGGPGKRCVFSDTETLLYDTSSDAEGHSEDVKQTTDTSVGRQVVESAAGPVCSDEDVEIAAALGRREGFFSSCRDLGRNRDPDYYEDRRHRKRKSSKTSLTATDPTTSDDLEVIITPGYLRLSMAESLVTHEDFDSVCSTPTDSQQCKTPEGNKDKKPEEDSTVLASAEEHYMPMTPSRKAVLAPPDSFSNARSPSASHTVIMENIFGSGGCGLDFEESSYVEMTEDGLIRSLLAPEPNPSFLSKLDLKKINSSDSTPTYATPESPRYCEIGSAVKENNGVTCHYEFLYKASTQYEPVYMEVSPLMEALKVRDKLDTPEVTQAEGGEKKENCEHSALQDSSEKSKSGEEDGVEPLPLTPPRSSLPDILNSSSAAAEQHQQQKTLSKSDRDSSDADDEASKDLDSLDAPRHPRFSLSDTFRPASYYLGASSMSDRALMVLGGVATSTVEHHDSSDSDLVSPPPIPTSPPPLDDLDNSLELHDATLNIKKQSPMPSKCGSESESNEKEEARMLWSKSPGHAKDTTSDRHESLLISPFCTPPVYGSGDVHSSGSESADLRNEQDSKTIDRLLKRRPVSDDMIGGLDVSGCLLPSPYTERRTSGSDLESVGSRSGLAMDLDDGVSIDLDQYLEDLQARDAFNVDVYSKDVNCDYYKTYRKEMHGLNENVDKIPQKIQPSSNNTTKNETPSTAAGASDPKYCIPDTGRAVGNSVQPPDINYAVEGDIGGLPYPHFERSPPKSEEVQYENLQMILPPPPQHANVPSDAATEITSPPDASIKGGDDVHSTSEARGLDNHHAGAPYYYSDLLKGDEDRYVSSTTDRNVTSSRGYPCHASSSVTMASRVITSSASHLQPLNNQRDLLETSCFVKRNDIGRKVNAIRQSSSLTVSSLRPQHVASNEDENRRLAEELRSSTVHFLGAANKRDQVDERNLYEADTIQRRKAMPGVSTRGGDMQEHRYRCQTTDFRGNTNTVNLYPHGLRDKSSPLTGDESDRNCYQPQRRSRSLEGLIDDPNLFQGHSEPQSTLRNPRINRMLQSSGLTVSLTDVSHTVTGDGTPTHQNRNVVAVPLPTTRRQEHQGGMRKRPPPPVPEEVGLSPCEGDDLWEEDALWRESLRRVSLRHTRSLDNLDGGRGARSSSRLSNSSAATTTSTMEQSGDLLSGGGCVRQRISREVIYVNDSAVRSSHQHRPDPSRQREYEDYREGRRRIRRRPQQSQGRVSDDVSPGAERDDGVHYERLSRYSESLERTRRGQTYLEGYVWDEDQETFRKHRTEPASSRRQHQPQQQQHFLEDASLPPQPPPPPVPPPHPPPSFEIDREKLRQWDFMSSAPLLQQQMLGVSTVTPTGARQQVVVGGMEAGVVVGAVGEETLPDTGGRQQQQQRPWHLLDLTMSHADDVDPTVEGNRPHSSSAGE
jgi:hypothetical protein